MPTFRQRMAASMLHCYPFYSGCGRVANSRLVRALAGESGEETWAKMRNGRLLRVALDDFDGRGVFYTGDVDRKISTICSRVVRAGDTVLDIGANVGLISFTVSPLVGATGHVHAFEPNPRLQEFLEESIARNSASNISLHRFALGEARESLQLAIPDHHSGRASLVRERPSAAHTVIVEVRTLNDVLEEVEVSRPRLVKLDVEGFEPQVLRGAADAFSKSPPDVIVVELNERSVELIEHPTIVLLRDLGYVFLAIPRGLTRIRPVPIDPGLDEHVGNDVIAVHRTAEPEVMTRLHATRWTPGPNAEVRWS